MNKKITYVVLLLSVTFPLFAAPVATYAFGIGGASRTQADSTMKASSTINSSQTTASTESTTTDDSTGRTSRLDAYKKNLKENLTPASKSKIIGQCVAAQAIVKAKATSNTAIATAREKAYIKIISNLQSVVSTASEKGGDVTALQANIASLQAKIVSFKADNATFQLVLSDLSQLDCKTDPTAFKAALEAARINQAAVLTSAKDIRSYLNDTVKVTLKALKATLKS